MAVVQRKPSAAPLKDLYDIGEMPPLGHVPPQMHAWAIRKERHGPPDYAMLQEVLPTWPIAEDEVLVYVMAGGVNYNGVWAGLGIPVSPLDGHKHRFHIAGSDASGVVWAIGSRSSAGRSATKSSFTAIRTTATTKTATAAIRCCRRRSASGVTRRRTARSRNSAACSRAS